MAEVSNIGMPGMEEIGQLIRLKERRSCIEIHDMRCANLEKLVEERDGLVAEAAKRFELAQEDFSYNLILLGARDEEIDRLETELITKTEGAPRTKVIDAVWSLGRGARAARH